MAEKHPQTSLVESPINTYVKSEEVVINLALENEQTKLHRVALSGDVTSMNRMLNYTISNTATLKELLAGECSLSNEMKVIIELKIDKIKLENVSMPMYIEKSDCNKLLNHYFYLAVKSVCCKEFQEENPILFHEACGYIFYLLTGKPISTLSAC